MTYYSALHYAAKAEKSASEAALHNLKNKLTNCVTEIPQDIKLEIDSSGKCWLKAGSKCYKPNGTVINIVKDLAVGRTSTGQEFIGVSADGSRMALNVHPSRCYSGTTAPTGFSGYGLWLDTNSMTYKYSIDGGSTWTAGDFSLPIALVTMKNVAGEVSSIDQVFNGFGYIGSTVFALPGVKGLIPDGRNDDGSLRNIEFTMPSVKIYTSPTNYTFSKYGWVCDAAGSIIPYDLTKYEYREDENYNYELYNNEIRKTTLIAYGSVNAGVTTSFTPKLPFRAADDQEVVKTSGSQAISGQKTFKDLAILNASNNAKAFLKSQTMDITTAPTTNQTNQIYFGDKNEFVYGVLQANQNTDKQVSFLLTARNGTSSYGSLGVVVYPDNSISTVAPATPTNATGNQIATASWVRSKAAGFPNYSAAVSIADSTTSYTPPSNGIIQMGYLSAGDNSYSGGVTHSSGVDMVSQYSAYKYSNGGTFWCIVEKGVKYTLTASQPNKKFIPFK